MKDKEKRLLKSFGAHIKQIRKDKGMTVAKVCVNSNIEPGNYQRIESGRTNPTLITIQKVAAGLDVDIDELMRGFKGDAGIVE